VVIHMRPMLGHIVRFSFVRPTGQGVRLSPIRRTYALMPSMTTTNVHAKPGQSPAVIPGKSGAFAMFFYVTAYKQGGDEAVKQFEHELNVLTWKVRGNDLWKIETGSPLFPVEERIKIATARLTSEKKFSEYFVSCIAGLIKLNGISRLEQIRSDYEEIMRAHRREIDIVLITKEPLTPELLEFYKKSIKLNFLRPEDNMIFTHTIDPSIINGYRITKGGKIIDFAWNISIAQEQERFRQQRQKKYDDLMALRVQPPKFSIKELLASMDPECRVPNAFAKFIEQ